jgi:hypothetical protein
MDGKSQEFPISDGIVADMVAWIGCPVKMFKHGHNDEGDSITPEDIKPGDVVFAIPTPWKVYIAVWARWMNTVEFHPLTEDEFRLWKDHPNGEYCIEESIHREDIEDIRLYEGADTTDGDVDAADERSDEEDPIAVLPKPSWGVPYAARELKDSCLFYRAFESDKEAYQSLDYHSLNLESDGWVLLSPAESDLMIAGENYRFKIDPEEIRDGDFPAPPDSEHAVVVTTASKRASSFILTSFPEGVLESLKEEPSVTAIKQNYPAFVPSWAHPISNIRLNGVTGETVDVGNLQFDCGEEDTRCVAEWIEPAPPTAPTAPVTKESGK